MAGYKERLTADLDRWIAAGHVSADRREAILTSVPDTRRLDAASALAWVGAILLGVAVIAFIAANWDGLSRLARFSSVLALFLVCAGAGAWAAHAGRQALSNGLLTLAALLFAAAIGLTGQIFDIAGDPRAALLMAGAAASALALAGRSSGAAIAALVFLALSDGQSLGWFRQDSFAMPWTVIAAPIAGFLALRWRTAPLAHAAALAIVFSFVWLAARFGAQTGMALLFLAVWLGALAAAARWFRAQGRDYADVFYGWFAWAALAFFALSNVDRPNTVFGANPIAHRAVWLALSVGAIALGRLDRHALVTAAGVVSLIGAIAVLLMDWGLNLTVAAGVFLVCAVAALIVGFSLRRRAKT